MKAVWLGNKGEDEESTSLRAKIVDTVMGVKKPTFKRAYNPTRLNSNYLFHSISMMMVCCAQVHKAQITNTMHNTYTKPLLVGCILLDYDECWYSIIL